MIELIPHTAKWKNKFNQLKEFLLSLPNTLFLEIAHIGSTAIETAPAKDIVDIQCAIASFEHMEQVRAVLEPIGFVYIEAFNQDHIPFQEYDYFLAGWEKRFFTGTYANQTFNIHIRLKNSINWQFAEQFRDFMITHNEARYAYMQFKERLASSGVDRHAYCVIKDSVIDLLSLQFFKQDESKK